MKKLLTLCCLTALIPLTACSTPQKPAPANADNSANATLACPDPAQDMSAGLRSDSSGLQYASKRAVSAQMLRDERAELCRNYSAGILNRTAYQIRLSRLGQKSMTLSAEDAAADALAAGGSMGGSWGGSAGGSAGGSGSSAQASYSGGSYFASRGGAASVIGAVHEQATRIDANAILDLCLANLSDGTENTRLSQYCATALPQLQDLMRIQIESSSLLEIKRLEAERAWADAERAKAELSLQMSLRGDSRASSSLNLKGQQSLSTRLKQSASSQASAQAHASGQAGAKATAGQTGGQKNGCTP